MPRLNSKMRNWIEPYENPIPTDLQALTGGNVLLTRILAQRGYTTAEVARAFLDPDFYQPASPTDLPGMVPAIERLQRAIKEQKQICVWGDFDVDGQTATTILVSTLRDLGAQVTFHIPVRAQESHGVNLPVLKQLVNRGAQLILTCDTGIAAHEAFEYTKSQGIDVIITDHHDLPPALPEAYCIINPKLLPPNHPLSTLPGVGVAYKLAEELYKCAGREKEVWQHLDLAALGIVADLALLNLDTRYLLQRGLITLRATLRLGLKILMEVSEVNPARLTETHIGFMLAPRMNALGRLADANIIVDFLTTADLFKARTIATQLEGLNAQRQLLTNQVFQAAQSQIERDPKLLDEPVLVLSHPTWPGGVVGIVASRLVERYHRPAVLISAPAGEVGRGSARSIEGCNITAAIAAQSEMLVSYGGHPMAAGLSIDPDRIPEFKRALARTVRQMIGDVRTETSLQIDGYLPLASLSLGMVEELERLAPFGPGNPPLTLVSEDMKLVSHSTLGRNEEHEKIILEDGSGNLHTVIRWQGAGWDLPQGHFDLAYTVRASNYRGQQDLQVEWVDARLLEEELEVKAVKPAFQTSDYRNHPQPVTVLKSLLDKSDIQVWCEGDALEKLTTLGIQGYKRYEIQASKSLAIWTTPPGRDELLATLERARPEIIYLFGIDPDIDQPEIFLKRLSGLVKFALRSNEGSVKLSRLATATAQREMTVRKGLEWLEARGHLSILVEEGDDIRLAKYGKPVTRDLSLLTRQIAELLQETNAYRQFFHRSNELF